MSFWDLFDGLFRGLLPRSVQGILGIGGLVIIGAVILMLTGVIE